MTPPHHGGDVSSSRSKGALILLFAVWALALVNGVVTVLLLQNYGEVKTILAEQDRQTTEIMDLQIRTDARLRRLEGRPPIPSVQTIEFRSARSGL